MTGIEESSGRLVKKSPVHFRTIRDARHFGASLAVQHLHEPLAKMPEIQIFADFHVMKMGRSGDLEATRRHGTEAAEIIVFENNNLTYAFKEDRISPPYGVHLPSVAQIRIRSHKSAGVMGWTEFGRGRLEARVDHSDPVAIGRSSAHREQVTFVRSERHAHDERRRAQAHECTIGQVHGDDLAGFSISREQPTGYILLLRLPRHRHMSVRRMTEWQKKERRCEH